MKITDFTDEELRAELKRRAAERRKCQKQKSQCSNCVHWNTIDGYGHSRETSKLPDWIFDTNSDRAWCPFQLIKSGKRHRLVSRNFYCEHFCNKNEE